MTEAQAAVVSASLGRLPQRMRLSCSSASMAL
jgi:hypothetical protein